jgi:outer membrane protein TolC
MIRFNIINQVKIAYFNALAKLGLLRIVEENLNILQDFSRKVEIKYKTGEGTNLERLTAKVQVSEAKNSLENVKNQLKTAFNELNFSIGFCEEDYIKDFVFADSLKYHEIKISRKWGCYG